MAELVREFYPSDDITDDLQKIDRDFAPGEHGEVVLRLDPDMANEFEKDNIFESAESMSQFLVEDGLMPWPGKKPVEVDWPNRTIHIYFIAHDDPGRYTPSYFMAAGPIAMALARAAPMAARGSALFSLAFLRPGAILGGIRTAITALGKTRFGRFFFSTSTLVIGGTLIWAMVDPDSLIKVFKYVAGAVATVVKPFMTPILIGAGVMLVGVVLLTRSR